MSGRIRTPTILQMEAAECGAAALGIILAYFGRHVPAEELRVACGISRNGSKANHIVNAARQYGLKASGAKTDIDAIKQLPYPFIAHWEFNHFVVIEGYHHNKVYINDPASGPRTISLDELDRKYTGVLLLFQKGESFKKSGHPSSVTRGLLKRLEYSKAALSLILLSTLFLIIPGIVIPGFSKIFVDDILVRGLHNWITPLIIGMLSLAAIQGVLVYLQQRYLLRLQIKLMLTAGTRFIWHILHLPMQFFYQRFSGDLGDRIDANDRVANLLSTELTGSLIGLISMAFFALVMFIISWPLAVIGVCAAIGNASLLFFVARKIADINRDLVQKSGRLTGFEMSSLQMIETLKATASESDFFKRWSAQHAGLINSQQKIAAYNQLLLILPNLLTSLSVVAILILGSWFIMQGQLTVGTLVAFQALLINFNRPLQTLLSLANSMQKIRGDVARLDDVLRSKTEPPQSPDNTATVDNISGAISLKKIQFGYSPQDKPLFDSFSLDIAAGNRVAIIGKSGSGKSTLAKIMCGLYQPWAGDIKVDQYALPHLSADKRAQIIGNVGQEVFLFEGTVRENLTMWNRHIDDVTLEWALHQAGLHETFLARGGLETYLCEGASNLSGGQRQRLEIARALVMKPKCLILDEATASLDPLREEQILNALSELKITLIIITHRLSAIRDCDEIILLENGHLIERGTHAQLMAKTPVYQALMQVD
jgi:NHLM bacteriocin system ABC transporter peptidase/ATP-binding protein